MAKLKLIADPTFKHVVQIPRAGAEPVGVEFTFKHRDREEMDKWVGTELPARSESEDDPVKLDTLMVMDCATGWELEDEFTEVNVRQMLVSYGGSALAIYRAYVEQLRVGKQKN